MTQARRQIALLLQRELAAARHGVAARAVFDALRKLQRGPELSEKPDTAAFRAWAIPPIDSHVIKTVCLTASRRKDPNVTGSKGDADTITCKFLAGGGTPKSGCAPMTKIKLTAEDYDGLLRAYETTVECLCGDDVLSAEIDKAVFSNDLDLAGPVVSESSDVLGGSP